MLQHLEFDNFKAWRRSGPVRLAPLTVLFGSNSAGKTSIPQLLLLLKQTVESSDRQQVLHLGDNRTLVDLGIYEDIVHNHDTERSLDFSFHWTLADPLTIEDPLSKRRYSGNQLSFACSLDSTDGRQPEVKSFEYSLLQNDDLALDLRLERKEPAGGASRRKKAEFELSSPSGEYELRRQSGRPWPLPSPSRFYGFPDEVTAHFQNAFFATDLALELERMLKGMYYLGPLREHPRRLYLWSGEVPEHVGERGDRAVEAILAAGDRSFNFRSRQRTKQLPALVAERLQKMGLISSFEVKPLGPHRKEYEVLVKTRSGLPEVKLTDVGFGVSQVLPVIVECFYVPRRSIVLFEQPEIHLHPRVQADLADLFVDAIQAREDGQPRDCQFIIESHSEHFLRRLQRRIAEGGLSEEDAALYFVHTEGSTARLTKLDVDPYGNIRNWPEGFFGDEMEDLVARAEAQARRVEEEKGR